MISLTQILAEYPSHLHIHRESILKEYLQYKILRSIFESPFHSKLVFLGGTALRIVYQNTRFSEDLDFDNFHLTEDEFMSLGNMIKKDLALEGLEVEITTRIKNAYHLKIKIPQILFDEGLSPVPDQKILIQVDTTPQNFEYHPNSFLLNRFDVFSPISVVPKDLLLSQKLFASVHRKRIMGRDFFDIVFLYGLGATPNFGYLDQKLGIKNQKDLKEYFWEKTKDFDFKELAKDITPFVFYPKDTKKVELFRSFVEQRW